MKRKNSHKLVSLVLAGLISLQSALALATVSEKPTGLVEDSPEISEKLEISPISEGFLEGQKSGVKESPLNLNFNYRRMATMARSMEDPLPSSYDLRAFNRVTPVRNQGKNGSCWAFASYGSMESVLSKYGTYDFSEKHLRNKHGFDWGINDGGNRDIATAYFARGTGPIREKDDPYDPVISVSPDEVERSLDIDNVIYLPDVNSFKDTKDIKRAIMNYGGVYTTINASSYYENTENYSYYNPGGGANDHAVTIVGWDDNFPKEMFNSRPVENGAWICKNSWGTNYMEKGYYYVSYYDCYAGKSNALFIPKKKDPNGKIYQHDPLGATRSVGFDKEGYYANIFTSEGDETLHEVGIYNLSMMTDYTIYLVKNVSRTSQLAKERVEIASGRLEYPGYYTVEVEPTELAKGEQFSIVVYMNSSMSEYRYPLAVETKIDGFSSQAQASGGQSYISSDGEKWSDLTRQMKDTNACIKAITTSGEVLRGDALIPDNPDSGSNLVTEAKNIYFREGKTGYLPVNYKGQITPVVEPYGVEAGPITYRIMETDIAEIDSNGVITPKKVGKANIYAEVQVPKGTLRARFLLDVTPKDIKIGLLNPIPAIEEIEYKPDTPEPGRPDERPEPPKPEEDPSIARRLYLSYPSKVLYEGESFEVSEVVNVYPETATSPISYTLAPTDAVTMDDKGHIEAKKPGSALITVTTENKLVAEFRIKVLEKHEQHPLALTGFEVSDRTAGIFTVTLKAEQDGKGYSGPVEITTIAGNEEFGKVERKDTIYFNQGTASIEYNGAQFAVWRTNFQSHIKLRDIEDTIVYEFSKDTKSPVFYKELPKAFKVEKAAITIGDLKVSDRKGGIFTLEVTATKDGQPYTGKGIITTSCDKQFRSDTVEFVDGKASIKYNGAQFYIWNKTFHTDVKIDNQMRGFDYERENQ